MTYEFSIGSFFIGLLILGAGIAFVRWHQVIADNLAGGVSSYDKAKLWAFATCGIGFIVMLNLHTLLLQAFFSLFFHNI
jgi:hypothetical protein